MGKELAKVAGQSEVDEGIEVYRDGRVGRVVIRRPRKRNAMTNAMMDELPRVLRELAEDDQIRCVLLTGAGDSFCAGGDLSTVMDADSLSDEELLGRMNRRHEAARLLHAMGKPTVAAVQGVAAGAGMALALACDILLMSERARLVTAFSAVGFSGDYGGTWTLQRLLGPARARALYFMGGELSAAEALEAKLVSRIIPLEQFDVEVTKVVQTIAEGPPKAFRRMKENMNRALECSFDELLRAEARASVEMMRTEDNWQALRAFAERRRPVFEGR